MSKWNMFVGILACAWVVAATYGTKPLWSSTPFSIYQGSSVGERQDIKARGCGKKAGCGMASAQKPCGCCRDKRAISKWGTAERAERVKTYLQKMYTKKLRARDITVKIQNFGCHMEADIFNNGKVLKRVSIDPEGITEIG